MTYADNEVWICYPVIAEFTNNFEKQVVITDIKSRMHCHIYTVLLGK